MANSSMLLYDINKIYQTDNIVYTIFRYNLQILNKMEIAPAVAIRDIVGIAYPAHAYGVRAVCNEIRWLRRMARAFCPLQDGVFRPSWVEAIHYTYKIDVDCVKFKINKIEK